jgi:hypothetical protein
MEPSDHIFNEVKKAAIELWTDIADHPSYLEEKTGKLKSLENVRDNFMYIVAMFDLNNQHKLSFRISKDAREAIHDRLIAGGQPRDLIVF